MAAYKYRPPGASGDACQPFTVGRADGLHGEILKEYTVTQGASAYFQLLQQVPQILSPVKTLPKSYSLSPPTHQWSDSSPDGFRNTGHVFCEFQCAQK